MDTIKKYLEEILTNENQIKDFLEKNENQIKSFFIDLWEKQSAKPVEETSQEEAIDAVAEQETDEKQEETTITVDENSVERNLAENKQTEEYKEEQKDMAKYGAENPPDKEQMKQESLAFQIKNKQITFKNGKINQRYEIDFDFKTLQIPEIDKVSFEKLEDIGLRYFPEKNKIEGTPTKAGDHKIEMKFKYKDLQEDRPFLSRDVLFIINPDPRELWSKNDPSPQGNSEFPDYNKPDSAKDFYKVESKKSKGVLGPGKKEIVRKDMIAASQRGRSHAIEGKPRDDDFALYFDEETEWYVMVVADGAGSAQFSRRGSQIACQTAIEVCKVQITEIGSLLDDQIKLYWDKKTEERKDAYEFLHQIVGKAAFEAYKKVCEEAASKERKPGEYATTLLLSICKKFDFGWFVGAFWVGDGGIGIYNKEKQEIKILGKPDGGEFAGQTRFLTMPEVFSDRPRTRFEIVEDFTAVILMSDGVTDPKFETDANLNRIEKWNELWDDLNGKNEDNSKVDFTDDLEQTADQLLKWLDFWSKGNHDDRTIAILF